MSTVILLRDGTLRQAVARFKAMFPDHAKLYAAQLATAHRIVHAGGVAAERASESGRPMVMAKRAAPPPPPAAPKPNLMLDESVAVPQYSSVAATAEGRDAGELFEYSFATPITVRKNESVMLPFLQQPVTARKLLIYTYGSNMANPLSAAEITNNTGKTLDGGPITVFDTATYAGEALMETLKKGDKRLISYGVDQGTRISTRFGSGSHVVRGFRLLRGVLTTRTSIQETVTFTINNVDASAKTIVLELPARSGYTLLNQKPVEKTSDTYRFEVKLAPSSTQEFSVSEEHVIETSNMVSNLMPEVLIAYSKNKNLSDAGRRLFEQIAAAKRAAAEAQASATAIDGQINELFRDQERLRQNIGSLNAVAGQQEQVQNYARALAGQEARLATLRDQQEQFRKQKATLVAEVNRLIETAEF